MDVDQSNSNLRPIYSESEIEMETYTQFGAEEPKVVKVDGKESDMLTPPTSLVTMDDMDSEEEYSPQHFGLGFLSEQRLASPNSNASRNFDRVASGTELLSVYKQQYETTPAPPISRLSGFFIPGHGISWDVISKDINSYLGYDASVRPGTYDNLHGDLVQGYWITAYRNLTQAMLEDLRSDSAKWEEERIKSIERVQTSSLQAEAKGLDTVDDRVPVFYIIRSADGLKPGPVYDD